MEKSEKEPSAVVNLVAYADNPIARNVELFHALLEELRNMTDLEIYCVFLDMIQAELNFNVKERFGDINA